jgi:ubiquinone/menaquinone biosynthesis C-methylase UbiE
MDNINSVQSVLGKTDIYLADQIMKGRYNAGETILDAGCGSGRNLHWFYQNGYNITGIDIDETAIEQLKIKFSSVPAGRLQVSAIENTPFTDCFFHHIICSAVLHFANDAAHFNAMLAEMCRVLKPGGTLFIRMTSDIGIENRVELAGNGVYKIPDGSTRFLLTRSLLANCMEEHRLTFAEPLKTVNVDDVRCMSTLLLQKAGTNGV